VPTLPQDRTDLPDSIGADYADEDDHRPLGGYAVLTTTFFTAFGGALLAAKARGRQFPERVSVQDVVLTGVATHKVARLIAKDKVTAFVRAPFTRFQESAGHGEVEEAARGTGLRMAIGELLVCPYCLAQWVAGAFTAGYLHAPRFTRVLTGMWTAHTIADAIQIAYSSAEQRS
jgi:Protein of unknown function (DUF1360)